MILISGHMVFGMLMFSYLFEWSAEDALYFVATTISTIGFGDIVPENTFAYLLFFVYIVTGKYIQVTSNPYYLPFHIFFLSPIKLKFYVVFDEDNIVWDWGQHYFVLNGITTYHFT